MTFAPMVSQKAIYDVLSRDAELASLLLTQIPTTVQRVDFNALPDSGSFDLLLFGTTSISILFDDLAADIQASIRLVTGYELVTVTGSFAAGFVFTFIGLETIQALMVVEDNVLLNGATPVVVTPTIVTAGSLSMVPQKVFDWVPENFQSYPYVVMNILPWSDRANRTWDGLEAEFQIDVWHRKLGTLKVQEIQKRIEELLHQANLCIQGWNIISMRRTFIDIAIDSDSVTRRGIQRFRIRLGRNSYQEP